MSYAWRHNYRPGMKRLTIWFGDAYHSDNRTFAAWTVIGEHGITIAVDESKSDADTLPENLPRRFSIPRNTGYRCLTDAELVERACEAIEEVYFDAYCGTIREEAETVPPDTEPIILFGHSSMSPDVYLENSICSPAQHLGCEALDELETVFDDAFPNLIIYWDNGELKGIGLEFITHTLEGDVYENGYVVRVAGTYEGILREGFTRVDNIEEAEGYCRIDIEREREELEADSWFGDCLHYFPINVEIIMRIYPDKTYEEE